MENLAGEALANFFPGKKYFLEPLKSGLINRSFKVTLDDGRLYFLQLINEKVFPQPGKVQANYLLVYDHFEKYHPALKPPAPVRYGIMKTLFTDSANHHWRVFEWVKDSISIPVVHSLEQVKDVAETFGKFTAAFADNFHASDLFETIPHFHDLSYRYDEFTLAVKTDRAKRSAACATLIMELLRRVKYKELYERITHSHHYPLRVVHHDAKISNILFHEKNGTVLCAVDMDTVMPGHFFSDPGDMIRSMAGTIDENDRRIDSQSIRKEYYAQIIDSYLAQVDGVFTREEKEMIHASGLIMTYMQCLRFLGDHLDGDIYYQVEQEGQNLDRAANQLKLLQQLESFLAEEYSFSII